jgi:phytoene/squalene synthetase
LDLLRTVEEYRRRVERIGDEQIRHCLMALYLLCARISEVVAYAYKSDDTVARGPRGVDARLDSYKDGGVEVETLV